MLLRLSRNDWKRRPLGACASSFNCASGAPASVVPAVALFPVKDYEHRVTRCCNMPTKPPRRWGKDIESSAKFSLSPKFDEAIRDGELALLPGERFVILDFEMATRLGMADS